ncbi:globin domain-containing protein [Hydrogenobacter thermophilus]|uniref:globin domain-containing protein n=1 Tax=Hydrogenobacter thermophilus TaxID=940 RepID=UPI0030F69FEE
MKMTGETKSAILKSVPFLQSQGEKLTARMYEILFEENPELKGMFESDNSKKLAGALLAYAQNLERLEILEPALNNMALAHVKAGVKPEHYQKVWKALYKAMKEMNIPEDIIKGWEEAYWFLAQVLVNKEKRLYECLTVKI